MMVSHAEIFFLQMTGRRLVGNWAKIITYNVTRAIYANLASSLKQYDKVGNFFLFIAFIYAYTNVYELFQGKRLLN